MSHDPHSCPCSHCVLWRADRNAEISNEVAVYPCNAVDALAWVCGKLDDVDLLSRPYTKPEAIFILSLPDLKSYRKMIELAAYWWQRGAVTLITRTGNPAVAKHLSVKNGCIKGVSDREKHRYLAAPDVLSRWLGKCRMTSPQPPPENAPTVKRGAIVKPKNR